MWISLKFGFMELDCSSDYDADPWSLNQHTFRFDLKLLFFSLFAKDTKDITIAGRPTQSCWTPTEYIVAVGAGLLAAQAYWDRGVFTSKVSGVTDIYQMSLDRLI